MKKAFFFSLICIITFSCENKSLPKEKPSLPNWLKGEWISVRDSVTFIESWKLKNESLFEGRGMATKGNDTLFSEKLEMRRVGDSLYYVPTVSAQNDGKSVWFKLTQIDSVSFLAEDQSHDFPKTIDYRLKGKDSLYAILKGDEKGKERTEIFPMKRK